MSTALTVASPSPSSPPRHRAGLDDWLAAADVALRTLFARPNAQRSVPELAQTAQNDAALQEAERRRSGALLRVDHVGEVCAQALYTAQALTTTDAALRGRLTQVAREETDHLAWTRARLDALAAHPSRLNPLWFAGAFAIGLAAGKFGGNRALLGFVVETEKQVEGHLDGHLERLPAGDRVSRAVLRRMRDDEIVHARAAERAGGSHPPLAVRLAMRAAARVMTSVARHI